MFACETILQYTHPQKKLLRVFVALTLKAVTIWIFSWSRHSSFYQLVFHSLGVQEGFVLV